MASLCRQPFNELHIRKNGDVYACAGGQFIGNLNLTSAMDLWNCERIIELRQQLTENNFDQMCLNCDLYNNKSLSLAPDNGSKILDIKALRKIGQDFFNGKSKLTCNNDSYGFVDIFKRIKDGSFIEGWAIDNKANMPASYVVLLVNGVYFYHSQVNIDRLDVAEALKNPSLRKCGFKFEAPFISVECKVSLAVFGQDYNFLGEIFI